MLFRNMQRKYFDQAGQDGTEGGGAADAPTEPEKLFTQADLDAAIAGLKSKNDELLGEKKTASQKAKEAEEARIKAEQEAAKKSGELDKFEQSLRGEFDKERETLSVQLGALQAKVTGESKKAILGSFVSEFNDPASIDIVSALVKTEFDGGDIKTQFTDFAGNVITTDPAEFKKWMSNHPAISALMRATGATGGGATGGKSGASGISQEIKNPKATEAIKKRDGIGHLNAHFTQIFKGQ